MPTGLSANIIFDVVGYFALSQATALDCVDLASGSTPIPRQWNRKALIPDLLRACAASRSGQMSALSSASATDGFPSAARPQRGPGALENCRSD
jgi:hypothetical protein